MTVIFARGTTEQGNVGNLVGPPLFMAIEGMVGAGNAAFQGVDYPADVAGFLAGGDPNGSMKMWVTRSNSRAALVMQAMADCPNTKVVMAGYSQGGQLVHNAADMLPPAVTAQVSAALIFGDPNNGAPVTGVDPAKTMVICHQNDNICQHGATILPAHLTYGTMNAAEGAAFVVQAAGMA
ncbi:cutinase [Zopfochytrium polystomum]|nr:cutinase [Zopfochytrium polystomum]